MIASEGKVECQNSVGWMRGTCQHGNQRWIKLNCKRRDCPVCGKLRQRRIAWRVEYGLQVLGDGAWFVGTWDYDVDKQTAVKTQQKFIRWIRRDQGIPVQYAAVWEETKSGRLHLNLILAPWTYINQRELSNKWCSFGGGFVVWIERIDGGIGLEVSKLRLKLGNYMAKFEQQVKEGRGINYSQAWPKPPTDPYYRNGHITWTWMSDNYDETSMFQEEMERGIWQEILPGEYSIMGDTEECNCFEFASKSPQLLNNSP